MASEHSRQINNYSLNTPLLVGNNPAFNVAGGNPLDYLKYRGQTQAIQQPFRHKPGRHEHPDS